MFLKLSRWFYTIGILLLTHSLIGQGLINDVQNLARVIEPAPQSMARMEVTEEAPSPNIMGILAAYAFPTREAALENSYSAEAILQSYRQNPYLQAILSDSAALSAIEATYDSSAVVATILDIRQGPRETILKKLSGADVYAENRMFRSKALIADYQLPRIENKDALRAASTDVVKSSLGTDPASLTANILSGVADWIADKAQEEFVQSFMVRLQEDLSEKQLDLLFPNAAKYLKELNVVNYRAIVANARLAFAQDFNTLSLNFSNYLFGSGMIPQNNPRSFNLLLFYRLIDLAQRELPLPEILAYANGEFSRRRFEGEKLLHDNLVADPSSEAFRNLQSTFRNTNTDLISTYDTLILLEQSISNKLSKIESEGRLQFPERNERVMLMQEKLDSFNYLGLFSNKESKLLSEVNAFLDGKLAYDILEAYPSFDKYEEIFSKPPPDSSQLRGVGLTMIRELLRSEEGRYPIVTAMDGYFQKLLSWEAEVATLAKLVEASKNDPEDIATQLRTELNDAIATEEAFWKTMATEHEQQAFAYLKNLVTNVRRDESLDANGKIVYLNSVAQLFGMHANELNQQYPIAGGSPYLVGQYQEPQHQRIYEKLDQNTMALEALQAALDNLEGTGENGAYLRSYENATIFGNILQAGTQLLYCLSVSDPAANELQWVTPTQLTEVLNNETQQQLFMGLLYQRISTLSGRFSVDSRGLAQIATQVTSQLSLLDTATNKRSKLLAKIDFTTSVLNSVLETPLLRVDQRTNNLESLAEKFQGYGIDRVPAINRNLNELFRHTENKDYRYALNNVVQLIGLFEVYPAVNRRLKKWNKRLVDNQTQIQTLSTQMENAALAANKRAEITKQINQLQATKAGIEGRLINFDTIGQRRYRELIFRYGQFMAELTAADNPKAVQAAFSTIALPKGSSQNKRLLPFSVELNAFFGGTFGFEKILNEPEIDVSSKLNSYGLFVPIGIAVSKQLGKKSKTSLSLFFPIVDLGALTSFRTDANNLQLDALPEFSFANVLAPGAHLFLNLPKSPFFLGGGFQYGPNVRKYQVGGENQDVRSLRFMFTFGIDVPLLSFTSK